jgi:nicotinamide-nucleotide adenylyltransferase
VGRFQPFHLGHLQAIKHILGRVDDLIILVGSAQHSHTYENPFTAGERITMIRHALKDAKINPARYSIIPLPDAEFHKVWVAHLLSQIPEFQTAFTNEPLTARLLKEAKVPVEKIPFFNRERFNSTEVRRRMANGTNWASLTPKSVAVYLNSIDAVNRIKEISSSDKPPLARHNH